MDIHRKVISKHNCKSVAGSRQIDKLLTPSVRRVAIIGYLELGS